MLSAVAALVLYRGRVLPAARAELRRWEARAARMPQGPLREAALEALREKRANPEATAVFAILAPPARRAAALQAMVALQVATDYLDSLGEQAGEADPLADGLALHGALPDAVRPGAERSDWYRLHPRCEDGDYLADLVGACRSGLALLPAQETVAPALHRAARRCGEGQSHTHAAAIEDGGQLQSWAAQLGGAPGCSWWELAAGASSSVATHALIAAAADEATSGAQAELVDAAYFPAIGALTVLLDDLVDREADLDAGEHNYLSYYRSGEAAAEGIGRLAERARAALTMLPRRRRHGAILAGVAGFYLGAAAATDEYAGPIRECLLEALGPSVRAIMVATRRGRDA
jgi:tetraprenyl-beta-curcumene synthase